RGEDGVTAPAPSGLFGTLLDNVTLDSALAYYHENGRIRAVEPIVDVSKVFSGGSTLGVDGVFDSLSGSTPNGALPSRAPQTFASPSAKGLGAGSRTYTTAPGGLPVDPHYHDERVAFGLAWNQPLTRTLGLSLGAKVSDEHDFVSLTTSASLASAFNEKNTTVSLGITDEIDSVKPIGGAPLAGSNYALFEKTGGSKSKDGVGALLGVTQIITRQWISEFDLSADRFTGYLNDPYKIISVLDGGGHVTGYQYESRPDERTRRGAYLENRLAGNALSAALSLRYTSDDWRVRSDTAELRMRWTFAERVRYLEPVVRWYRQTAADFYVPWLDAALQTGTTFASSDSRLAPLHSMTYGIKFAERMGDASDPQASELNVRLQYYRQTFDSPRSIPAALQGLDLIPALNAIMLQVGWRF
ncbi:MAG TPA: DUF3570 domain-containing protein, partial [Steroidobacteraceae bacterium]|nr:DUF3570 domain-containing protein [Steroidobacteraceae bacterium]